MKHLETPESREAFEAKMSSQMLTMKAAWMALDSDEDRTNLDLIFDGLSQQWLYSRSNKEWLFSFNGGGWNSVMAADKATAIKLAVDEYAYSPSLNVDVTSFRIKTAKDYESLLSLFY